MRNTFHIADTGRMHASPWPAHTEAAPKRESAGVLNATLYLRCARTRIAPMSLSAGPGIIHHGVCWVQRRPCWNRNGGHDGGRSDLDRNTDTRADRCRRYLGSLDDLLERRRLGSGIRVDCY